MSMTYTLLTVSSITYAMKGKTLLNKLGYYCEIERQEKNRRAGCGYVLKIRDDPQLISGILAANGIMVKDRSTVTGKR